MSNIGLFYGSTTGKTEYVAEMIQTEFGDDVTLHNIAEVEDSDFEDYQNLIIACPTWNIGELQSDWDGYFPELEPISEHETKLAITINSWMR